MRRFPAFLVSVLLILSMFAPFSPMIDRVQAQNKGPRSDVRIMFYADASDAYTALKNGSIDFLYWSLNSTFLNDARNDTNLVVSEGTDTGIYELDINNNYTIRDYPSVKSPTYELKFRQAMACAFDKDYVLNTYVADFGARIDQPLHALSGPWLNESYLGDGYPYRYNMTNAAELLAELGFSDTDENGWLNYPSDWPGAPNADFTEYPLKIFARPDHQPRLEAGRHLTSQLESLGVKCNESEVSRFEMYTPVMRQMNYHVYTGGWKLARQPAGLDTLFHSNNWFNPPNEEKLHSDYVTGLNETGLPNYPEFDDLLVDMNEAATIEEAQDLCQKAMGFFVDHCINIPLYSTKFYTAYRKEVHGVCSTPLGSWSFMAYNVPNSVLNKYTLLNAYKDDGQPLNVGFPTAPNSLNPLDVATSYDSWPLSNIYDELIQFQPSDPLGDQPWAVTSWNVSTWLDTYEGETKTKITFYLRNDSQWIRPLTGETVGQVMATDLDFGLWYLYQTGWINTIHHSEIVNSTTLDIYMDVRSIFVAQTLVASELATYVLPMQVWTNFTQLTELMNLTFVEGVNATTSGYLDLPYETRPPVVVVSVKANDSDLVKYVDYRIERGGLMIMTDLPDNTVINATYWAYNNATGFYPGNLPWQDILVGNGPFYVNESDPVVGGHVYLKANPDHFMLQENFERDVAVQDVVPTRTTLARGEILNTVVQVENRGNVTENFRVSLYANNTKVGMQYVYNLLPNATKNSTLTWNTTGFQVGKYQLKAEAETVTDETQTSDNTCTDGYVYLTLASSENCLHISPPEATVTHGVDECLNVLVSNIPNLYGFEVELRYNTTLLDALNVSEGTFLKQVGSTMIIFSRINDTEGRVELAVSLLSVENGASGNGTLFSVGFNSSMSATGNSPITLARVKLSDPQSQPIPYQCINGSLRVVEVDTRNYTTVKNETGYVVSTVSNSTVRSLTFNESDNRISMNVSGPSGNAGFCNFAIPKTVMNGTFAVLVNNAAVYCEVSENETHYVLSFNFTHSFVKIDIILTFEEDLNGDREIGISDVVVITWAYGSGPGDPNWNPIADVIKDGKIDIYDAVAVCHIYGKKWTP